MARPVCIRKPSVPRRSGRTLVVYEDRNSEKPCVPDFRTRRSRHNGWILVLLGLVIRQGWPLSLIASCFRVSHLPRGHHSFHLADSDVGRDIRQQGHHAVSAPRTNFPAAGKAGIALLFAVVYHRAGLPEPARWAKPQAL